MQKRNQPYLELSFAGALLLGACAGAQATQPTSASASENGEHAPTAANDAQRAPEASAAHGDSSCPSDPVTLAQVRPLVDEYCVSCHSPGGAAGEDYDFRSDSSIGARRHNIEAKLRLHVMPPPNAHQPSDAERLTLRCWAKR